MDWSSITPAVVIAVCSLFTAVCSFYVSLSNYRRSNYSVIKIVASGQQTSCAEKRGWYSEYTIAIQNFGIPLHNIGMRLEFSPGHGSGWASLPILTKERLEIRNGQFAKGAITAFRFSTDDSDGNHEMVMKSLTNLKTQRAMIIVTADKYTMWSYRLQDRFWWLKRRWNRFAQKINWASRRSVKNFHGNGIKLTIELPKFDSPGQNLMDFITAAQKLRDRPLPACKNCLATIKTT